MEEKQAKRKKVIFSKINLRFSFIINSSKKGCGRYLPQPFLFSMIQRKKVILKLL